MNKPILNILIACEYSGAVRTAFKLRGHNVLSCDLLESQTPGNHYKGDIFKLLDLLSVPGASLDLPELVTRSSLDRLQQFPRSAQDLPGLNKKIDLLICFPPCTYLAKAQQYKYGVEPGRIEKRDKALSFIKRIYSLDVEHIAIENPVGYLNTHWSNPTQTISPHLFGDPYQKEICLWLKNLNPLKIPIDNLYKGKLKKVSNHVNSRMSKEQKNKIKSSWLFFPALIDEMVLQWSESLLYLKERQIAI